MLENFKIGHITDEINGTGVSVILCEEGAVGGVSVRGSSPATRETDLLKSGNTVEEINAVVLSGGSAYGLEAGCGVMEYLRENGYGYPAGGHRVPIVCGASLYDLEYKEFAYPSKRDGYDAAKIAAKDNFVGGRIGAGTGCTVGKIAGMKNASKSGLGVGCAVIDDEVELAVIVAVNALGDVYDVETNEIIAGVKGGEAFLNTEKLLLAGTQIESLGNTTIACILTNAALDKTQMNKLCDIAHDGYALAIRPVHTVFDGDAIFGMSKGNKECNFTVLSTAVVKLLSKAIGEAVK